MNKSHLILLALLLVIIIAGASATTFFRHKADVEISNETKKIFAGVDDVITYTDINGNEVSLEEFLGKVLVVTTWASWSPYTVSDFEILKTLASKYSKDKVVFIAINRKETREQAQRYVSTLSGLENIILVIDQEDHFYKSIGGNAMPESVVFDTRGTISLHVKGILNETEIVNTIDTIIQAE